jgi:putative transposase
MPRIPRGQVAGHAYHVLNRGNGGATVFHKDGDYVAFLHLLGSAKLKFPVKVLGFCLMPNHFHLVVQPTTNVALSTFMQWWMTSHVRRYHKHYQSQGHVWQGRFKCFPIQQDEHLLTVLRYVYRNPVRAGLAATVMEWPWSSLRWSHLSDPLPLEMPRNWLGLIEGPLPDHDVDTIRTCVNRQRPYGSEDWQTKMAAAHGLESTLRKRGRPATMLKK